MMPLGIRCSAVFTPLITSVCPALWPPWKRTTPCAISVSQSTSLPLPSSPHWVPTTTTLRPLVFVIAGFRKFRKSGGLDPPFGAFAHELAVAVEFVHFAFVAGQRAHDRLAPRKGAASVSSSHGARIAALSGGLAATPASSFTSRLKPTAGRLRPNTAP